jgi:hypothetical protein
MVVGGYGSGKTEVAVNLALHLADAGRRVQLADLDLVNPYFRSREARALLESHGIRVVVPPGSQAFADLPIVLPEIRGMLHPPEGTVTLFDVGGDDVGARALASLRPALGDAPYELWQVVNAKRPFSRNVAAVRALMRELESASRLAVTGLLANSHLVDDTTAETLLEGWHLVEGVARETGLPIRGVGVMSHLLGAPGLEAIDAPVLALERRMLPPWARGRPGPEVPLPAARPRPIGRPPPLV